MKLDKYDKKILATLKKAQRELTTNQVAKIADVSWITAYEHLDKLFEEGYVERGQHIPPGEKRGAILRRIYWRLNY